MANTPQYLQVALPLPLRQVFDYRPPAEVDGAVVPGTRVRVHFAGRMLIGIVVSCQATPSIAPEKIKPAEALLDKTALLAPALLDFIRWAANYYHTPIGEALQAALPVLLRQGEPAQIKTDRRTLPWTLTPDGLGLPADALARAPQQAAIIRALQSEHSLTTEALKQQGLARDALKRLSDKGLVEQNAKSAQRRTLEPPLTLSAEQAAAMAALKSGGFRVSLLDGTTGSGKTEVYLQAIAARLEADPHAQALVLVPEIGLTPQTLTRFRRRFGASVACVHSGLNDTERLNSWEQARRGAARIVIGTRSAIFTPLAKAAIIIVDEEHDNSFKQQDGFRYSARDLAVVRARALNIPVILGSATPALESLYNARAGRYQHLRLTERAGSAQQASIEVVDVTRDSQPEGFSHKSLSALRQTLATGNQALVFLNRRGFAPTVQCLDCNWIAECPNCDARLTLHHRPRHLHCHHCDYQRPPLTHCELCFSHRLAPIGAGTERSEQYLAEQFPQVPVRRIDRDSTRGKNAMGRIVEAINQGEPCILVGTQMLAKGHHFPKVTLVVILDADSGLFSADFRGPERMGQLLTQVAGRAGRAERPGKVIVQSRHSEHPLLQTLVQRGFHVFAQQLLDEREITQMPPCGYLALLRADAPEPAIATEFLQRARAYLQRLNSHNRVQILGPLPALMEKRGQRYRYQLQCKALTRGALQALISALTAQLDTLKTHRELRWSVDIDPQDMS